MGNPTLPNTKLIKGVWVNLYDAISTAKGETVAVGTAIGITLLQRGQVHLVVAASEPGEGTGYEPLDGLGAYAECESGDVGFWAQAQFGDVVCNLKEV